MGAQIRTDNLPYKFLIPVFKFYMPGVLRGAAWQGENTGKTQGHLTWVWTWVIPQTRIKSWSEYLIPTDRIARVHFQAQLIERRFRTRLLLDTTKIEHARRAWALASTAAISYRQKITRGHSCRILPICNSSRTYRRSSMAGMLDFGGMQ